MFVGGHRARSGRYSPRTAGLTLAQVLGFIPGENFNRILSGQARDDEKKGGGLEIKRSCAGTPHSIP